MLLRLNCQIQFNPNRRSSFAINSPIRLLKRCPAFRWLRIEQARLNRNVEPAGRLVHEHQPRLGDEVARDLQPLAQRLARKLKGVHLKTKVVEAKATKKGTTKYRLAVAGSDTLVEYIRKARSDSSMRSVKTRTKERLAPLTSAKARA